MCTAFSYARSKHYFGRNLDWTHSYGEGVVITPRSYNLKFKDSDSKAHHLAIMGMGIVADDYPLYFDGVNEAGLCMAGLNFPDNAVYRKCADNAENIASFELIPRVLSQCKTTDEAKSLLQSVNITDKAFSKELSTSTLHWIISDKDASIVCEPMCDGVKLYDNPTGVLTNSPPFPEQIKNIDKLFSSDDLTSSPTRFRYAVKLTSEATQCLSDDEYISQTFWILKKIGMMKRTSDENYSIYSSCINATDIIYYYKVYGNDALNSVRLCDFDLSGDRFIMI